MALPLDVSDDDLDLTGVLGLDFANTVVRTGRGVVDLLDGPDALVAWMKRAAGPALTALIPGDPPGRRRLTAEARDLREAVVSLFAAVAASVGDETPRVPPSTAFALDRALRRGGVSYRFAHPGAAASLDDGAHFDVEGILEDRGPLSVLTPIARSAVETARDADPARLRACAADDCARWFVDTSKGGQRRWCSMARCGNRMKAARYRARQRGEV